MQDIILFVCTVALSLINIMMVERWGCLLLVRALVFAEAAKSLEKVTNQTVITIQNAQILESSISLNQSFTSSNSSIDNRVNFVCDALIYGASLDLRDCQEALNFFHSSDDDHAWVDRRGGHGGMEFQLPFRTMGSKLVDIFDAIHLADTRYRCRELLSAAKAKNKRNSWSCEL